MDVSAQPFTTTNEALACALRAFGVPWWQEDDAPYPTPCVNSYTADTLRADTDKRRAAGMPSLGLEGRSLEEAIVIAHRAGVPGQVKYYFRRTPILLEVLAGWDEQSDLIRKADESDPDADTKTGTLIVSPRDAARIACQFFKTQKDFKGTKDKPALWKRVKPVAVRGQLHTRAKGDEEMAGSVTRGSYSAKSVRV